MNAELIHEFELLKQDYENAGDKGRTMAYNRAVIVFKSFKTKIVDVKQLDDIGGIGPTIKQRVKQFLKKGQVYLEREAKEIKTPSPVKSLLQTEFEKIWGVGSVKARKLIEENKITSIDELRKNTFLLTDQQKIGLLYFDELQKRVSRSTIEVFESILENIFPKHEIVFKIAGSYRRKKEDSGDVDCVVYSTKSTLENCVNLLIKADVVIHTLSMRGEKFLGIAKIEDLVFRLDIEFVKKESFNFALLYFTGSKEFNISMRSKAKAMGFLLNEHGLYRNGLSVLNDPESEREIFTKLEMAYVKPSMR